MATIDKCSIWGTKAQGETYGVQNFTGVTHTIGIKVNSVRVGGYYKIDIGAHEQLNATTFNDDLAKAKLTTWLIDQRRLGTPEPLITSEIFDRIKKFQPLTVSERADRLLKHLQTKIFTLGDEVIYYPGNVKVTTAFEDDPDTALMYAFSESIGKKEELNYLLEYLVESKYLNLNPNLTRDRRNYKITANGYAYLANLENKLIVSSQAFVAMWFDKEMSDAYQNGFELGIRGAGYNPVRIDKKNHNNKIDDEMIAEIRRSRFVVADFTQGKTGARGGVYYEAGFAHGLNIPVIFTCRTDAIDEVHFDTRQFNHIVWSNPEELGQMLRLRIAATIGEGPVKFS